MKERVRISTKTPEIKRRKKASQTRKADTSRSINPSADRVLFLQRTIGNQAVQRLLKSGTLFTKLRIGQSGDTYEQEADRVADAVMRTPENREEIIQAKMAPDSESELNPGLEARINAVQSGGQPLPESVRAFFEPRFGYDFSQVKLHNDTGAAESARSVGAQAYTVGRDIVFGAEQYAPETSAGRNLLAHELAHVVQQGGVQSSSIKNITTMSAIQRRLVTFGTLADVNDLLGLIGPPAGLTLNLDIATNQVRIGAVLPAAPQSPALRAQLTTIINHATRHAEIVVGRGQPGVMVGAFPQPADLTVTRVQQIDIDDIRAIEAGAPGNGVAKAAHEIQENFQAHSVQPVAGRERFTRAHERAVEAESAVTAELIQPGRRVADVVVPTSPTTRTMVQDFENYYLIYTVLLNPATQSWDITSSRRAVPVIVSTRTIDNFASGSTAVPGGGAAVIASAAADVAANPTSTVLIEGFTDASGSAAGNLRISRRRAEHVRDALGVGRNRVHTEGRGETNFVAANDTPANRALNRRVVITVRRPGP